MFTITTHVFIHASTRPPLEVWSAIPIEQQPSLAHLEVSPGDMTEWGSHRSVSHCRVWLIRPGAARADHQPRPRCRIMVIEVEAQGPQGPPSSPEPHQPVAHKPGARCQAVRWRPLRISAPGRASTSTTAPPPPHTSALVAHLSSAGTPTGYCGTVRSELGWASAGPNLY